VTATPENLIGDQADAMPMLAIREHDAAPDYRLCAASRVRLIAIVAPPKSATA
jgi:hypothetical protein